MHELSLAQNLLDQLLQLSKQHDAKIVTKATVIIGPFSGIVVESFAFGFNAIKQDHPPTATADLILETPAPEYICLDCNTINTGDAGTTNEHPKAVYETINDKLCSACGSSRLSPSGGTELILKQLEME
ncbi:hydrogenase maturation nickel metallochaperone HypA [Desulfogranum marinum]|jgi:hydrogenase nickel incorporation protein HypA/HybF|uniref:hydrogenase maturation nickel metallochaperone HypA/HybF n=1 Tax=Desulfogranum marinum TaxID=453220 RepID=UPI001963BB02|nr:hydrogenase maturation nickel metallochaperone HypA [Desulfogranum marinum]MBM9514294.1 hydrogenase maturation nickel metallochaperone HypA [Desulfogranum marinum]